MARKNRVSVQNGTYHVTTRIVNREMWFKSPAFKDRIVSWMYGIAAFSGVELLSWCVMDNHFHILVHVPEVPERYRTECDVVPDSYAFGMRPPECNSPLWSPPPDNSGKEANSSSKPGMIRPKVGFMLSDEEMLDRLLSLYGNVNRIEAMRKSWKRMRENGNASAVDALKERYCRRMYNLSQFVKTLKERISQHFNKASGHIGNVFEGRFHSGLVQEDQSVKEFVALYIDYNPYRACLVDEEEIYKWSSLGQACGEGAYGEICRRAYERIYDCSWQEAYRRILSAFRERLSQKENLGSQLQDGNVVALPGQLVHIRVPALSQGAFIGRSVQFGKEMVMRLTKGFPCSSFKSLMWLERVVIWPDPHPVSA